MKTFRLTAYALGILAGTTTLQACQDVIDENCDGALQYTALVTVRPTADGTFVMQLDSATVLHPSNMNTSPFGNKEVRALVNYTSEARPAHGGHRDVYINWIDSIRTKMPVLSLGEKNDSVYGHDAIEIVKDWVTIAEDGYLTLRVRVLSNGSGHVHYLNLLSGVDADDPYTVELRHDAKGDVTGGYVDGIIAFNLGALPDTNGEIVKLTLKWRGYSADKSVTFDYCTRRNAGSVNTDAPINVQSLRLKVD